MNAPQLPFSGRTSISRHCSYMAAKAAAPKRASKSAKYLGWLKIVASATDWQAADHFNWPLSSVCSIRAGLVEKSLIHPVGIVEGRFGKKVTAWAAR